MIFLENLHEFENSHDVIFTIVSKMFLEYFR